MPIAVAISAPTSVLHGERGIMTRELQNSSSRLLCFAKKCLHTQVCALMSGHVDDQPV
jgi:hypothetical protein